MPKKNPPFTTSPGDPFPLGATPCEDGINFALFARHADSVVLLTACTGTDASHGGSCEIVLEADTHRTGDIWHIRVLTKEKTLRYGYRVIGKSDPTKGFVYTPERVLLDPYCTQLCARPWGAKSRYGEEPLCLSGRPEPFNWQGDSVLKTPAAETIIYELHVRGFTRHRSSGVDAPGTYRSIVDKIPYLKELGVTAVELMPVTEWDETDNKFYHPETGEQLLNYWGYNPISFFALKSGYAADPDKHINEFKEMVRSLHLAGIEVILDLVFNHTGEIEYDGKTTCFRGIENPLYYMVDQASGDYLNFSGCGNTLNCNHPVVRKLILDALHYWVSEMHIDGFRFDLAAIFSRDQNGNVLDNPPLVELIAEDPLLRDTKIIAEAWDASGLYQVGSFSNDPRWAEWNGKFRDDLRQFMMSNKDTVRNLATRVAGSSDLYDDGRGPLNSVNFITSHDGFTLYDLVSYNEKHNQANGEQNRDGEQHNLSWNSGHEGDDCPKKCRTIRFRRIRTFAALLLLSQGMPMITAGDEFGRTQQGNNNSWCQDNELGWIDWSLAEKNQGLLRFFRKCIALRKKHPVFRRTSFFKVEENGTRREESEITWQSLLPGRQNWSASCHTLAFLLHGHPADQTGDGHFFVMANGSRSSTARFVVPEVPTPGEHTRWFGIIDSSAESPDDIKDIERAEVIAAGSTIPVPKMGLIVLQAGH